jgi:hypothetical protein
MADGTPINWAALIGASRKRRAKVLKADLFLGALESKWRAVKLRVEGGGEYAVKGLWRPGQRTPDNLSPGRTIFNENVAARLGGCMAAPVAQAALIDVSQEVIDSAADAMDHLRSGIAHGARYIENCKLAQPKHHMRHPVEAQNRARFALLAVMFGWMNGPEGAPINDAEFLYDKTTSDVYGIDFGNFFGGPTNDLRQLQSKATPNAWIKHCSELTREELASACQRLSAITPDQIADALAAPPDEWGIKFSERVEFAKLLFCRQAELVVESRRDREDVA